MRASRFMGTRLIVGAAGSGICALAVAVLIGWQIHSRSLIQVTPTLAPMQRLTAVVFLLSGTALLFLMQAASARLYSVPASRFCWQRWWPLNTRRGPISVLTSFLGVTTSECTLRFPGACHR